MYLIIMTAKLPSWKTVWGRTFYSLYPDSIHTRPQFLYVKNSFCNTYCSFSRKVAILVRAFFRWSVYTSSTRSSLHNRNPMRDNNRQVKLLYLGTNGSVEKSIIFPESMVFHPKSWATWASRYSRESVKSVDSLWLLIETMRYGCNSTNTITQLLAL